VNQVGDGVLDGIRKAQDCLCAFVVFSEYVQKTALLEYGILSPGRWLSLLATATDILPLNTPIEKGFDRIIDFKSRQGISIGVICF
jgi:hypothetical protein